MKKKFGYACVSSAFIPRTDPEALKGTKAYHALEDTFRFMKLLPENLYIDLLSPNYRRRKNLEVILDTAKPGDIVIVASVSALGFSPEEVRKNYYEIVSRSIGLFIREEHLSSRELKQFKKDTSTASGQATHLSTVGTDLSLPKEMYFSGRGLPWQIVQTMRKIDGIQIRTNRGHGFKNTPTLFKEVYWLYENYFLKEKDLYHNDAIDIGKLRFNRLASEYEQQDPEYEKDQKQQERLYQISQKPKRHGTVPENFVEFLRRTDSGEPLSLVIQEMGYPRLTPIDVERYRLKYTGGRSAVALANNTTDTPTAKKIVEDVMKKGRSLRKSGELE